MELLIAPNGLVHCLYNEELDLRALGRLQINRASWVEPEQAGRWWVDLSPSEGPQLGPFERRSQALEAERDWLLRHRLRREVS